MAFLTKEKAKPIQDILDALGDDDVKGEMMNLEKELAAVYDAYLSKLNDRKAKRVQELKTLHIRIIDLQQELEMEDKEFAEIGDDLSNDRLNAFQAHCRELTEEKNKRSKRISQLVSALCDLMRRMDVKVEDQLANYREGGLGYNTKIIKLLERKEKDLNTDIARKKKDFQALLVQLENQWSELGIGTADRESKWVKFDVDKDVLSDASLKELQDYLGTLKTEGVSRTNGKGKGEEKRGRKRRQKTESKHRFNSTLAGAGSMGDFQTPEILPVELKILSKIGSGCFGKVFKGTCRGKTVAIKQLHQQELEENLLEEFKKEVEIMTHLRHPNIVLYMGACTEPGNMAIVTELLAKGNLHDLLHNPEVDISLTQKIKMAKDVAQGMNWLHCSKPPIVHRDLKPTNLLVDDAWNVKVCDFGLSAIKRTATMRDNGVAPGTPLWMSPEVLQGKNLSEKVDIYSYGIVFWEVLTRKEPFEDKDSYNAFVAAVCDDQERPPVDDPSVPKELVKLLKDCWDDHPDSRPSFEEILGRLDEAAILCAISDPVAQELWKKNWFGKFEVSFSKFIKPFAKALKVPIPDTGDLAYKCLQSILVEKPEKDEVTVDRLGNFLHWFGPMHAKGKATNLVDKCMNVMNNKWFHGDISRQDSETLLSDQRKGSYLVRVSFSDPHRTPYTISKVSRKGAINHQRIYTRQDKRGYYIHVPKKDGRTVKVETSGGVNILIAKIANALYLKHECPGSKYNILFKKDVKVSAYLGDPEEME